MSLRLQIFWGFILVLLCAHLSAQTTGTITGVVTDPSNASPPGASVEVENVGTGLVRSGTTDSLGTYLISGLPVGSYKLTVKANGFKVFVRTGITLEVGENARADVRLEVGSTTETVQVQSEAVHVDTQSATLQALISSQQMTELPLNGRNPMELAEFLPGIGQVVTETAPTFQRAQGPSMSISGGRGNALTEMLDGAVMTDAMSNLGLNLPNPDTLDQFQVLTHNYSAEYGRADGGVILAVTKSGTNQFHGTLWEFLRNDDLDARNYFSPNGSKPFLDQNQFGLAAGGPVLLPKYNGRNRTFFFASYEGLRIREQTLITGFPPTAAERQGDFSASSTPVIDPTTGMPFPGNMIPSSRFDPLAVNMLPYVALPNSPSGELVDLRSNPTTGNQFNVKVDEEITPNDRLTFRYYRNRYENSAAGGGNSDQLVGIATDNTKSFSGSYNHIFTPNLINDFHLSYTEWEGDGSPPSGQKSPQELGAKYNTSPGLIPVPPQVTVTGRYTIAPSGVTKEPDTFRQLDDKVSWIHGRQAITVGFRGMLNRHGDNAQYLTSGEFSFIGAFTGNAMADYMIGAPSSDLQYSEIVDASQAVEFEPFVEDSVRFTRKLNVDLGLRYSLDTPWEQRTGLASQIRVGHQQSTRFPTAPPGLVFQGDPGIPRGMYPTRKLDFSPRIGIAWDPAGNGKMAIRAGYGIFFASTPEGMSAYSTNNPPFVLTFATSPPYSFSDPYHGITDPFPYVYTSNPVFSYPVEIVSINPGFVNGYLQQYNLNIQRELPEGFVGTIGYVGGVGHHLPQGRELNTAVYSPGATEDNVQQRRPYYPQYYAGLGTLFSDGNSNYNSLQAELKKQWSRRYTLQAVYTYSKSIDNISASGPIASGSINLQDPNNYGRGNRALSDFDQRHIFALNGVWQLPLLAGHEALLKTVAGGWQLAGSVRLSSGIPINVTSGCDCALIGTGRLIGPQRPNLVGNPNMRSGLQYFNPAAFADPAAGQFGTTGRNSLIGPGFTETDIAVSKRFPVWREQAIQFRVDLFNLFNNVDFQNPTEPLNSPGFGQLESADDPRIVQLGLKYQF